MPTRSRAEPVVIGDVEVKAGERRLIELPVAGLYSHTAVTMPVHVFNGRRAGPRLFVSAAIHGDELNGVEIIRRLIKHKSLKQLRGALIAIPVVNMFGLIQHSRYLPDRRDLNRSFPGSKQGSLAARLANIFLDDIVKQCSHGIDLHTGAIHRSNLPQIRANLEDEHARELAVAFGVPVVVNSNLRDGSLREAANAHGVTTLLYEAGEALRFDQLSIRAGVRGILRVMRHLDMLPRKGSRAKPPAEPFITESSFWVRAPHSGILRTQKRLGDKVDGRSLLGVISDPSDMFDERQYDIRTPSPGIIIGRTNLPLVNEGDALYHIACFDGRADVEQITAGLEEFQQEVYPD